MEARSVTPLILLLVIIAWQADDKVPPRDPWQQVNVLISRATQDCRLEDRQYSAEGLLRCIIGKLQDSFDGDKLREPESPDGGNYDPYTPIPEKP